MQLAIRVGDLEDRLGSVEAQLSALQLQLQEVVEAIRRTAAPVAAPVLAEPAARAAAASSSTGPQRREGAPRVKGGPAYYVVVSTRAGTTAA